METSYIVTFIGDDRPGLVETVAEVIEQCHGSWDESRLSQLGGKFAGLVLVTLPENQSAGLEQAFKTLSREGLSIRMTPTTAGSGFQTAKQVTLSVIGPNRLGIVREISRALAAHDVNVIEMDSAVVSAPMSGEQLFEALVDAEVSNGTSMDELIDTLDEIANQMTLDIVLEPS